MDESTMQRSPVATVPQIPVLNYHHVHEGEDAYFRTRPELLRRQMEILLEEGYMPIAPQHLQELKGIETHDRKYVLVTFDDAYENFLTDAWPILKELEIPTTLFVIVDAIGGWNDWDDTRWSRHRHLTLEQLQDLQQEGVVIGSHTKTHRPLIRLGAEDLEDELQGSRRALEEILGITVSTLAYPGGAVDDTVRNATATAYDLGFATETDASGSFCDPYLIARFEPCFCGDPEVFRKELRDHSGYDRQAHY